MRYRAWLAAVLTLVACSSGPANSAKLTLKNPNWDHVNVQVVITRSANCDDRGPEMISTKDFVMMRDKSLTVHAPNGASVCWRHDRFPDNPQPDAWSGWSRAILFPDAETESDL
jgi:hypothetical protein